VYSITKTKNILGRRRQAPAADVEVQVQRLVDLHDVLLSHIVSHHHT
jgi:predicted glycoside hydrolase/deacetylase ChbG (UPF0249 family)